MVGNGKQLEGFESKVKKPAEEPLKTSAKPSGEQLDLIEEESDEEDEDSDDEEDSDDASDEEEGADKIDVKGK